MKIYINNKKIILKTIAFVGFFALAWFFVSEKTVYADNIYGQIPVCGITKALENYYSSQVEDDATAIYVDVKYSAPEGVALANVNTSLNIRTGPSTSYSVCGILPKNGACIIKSTENGWAKIVSGDVEGYCSLEFLLTGEEAAKRSQGLAVLYATVSDKVEDSLRVRKAPSTQGEIITSVKKGESMLISKAAVRSSDGSSDFLWVEVYLNNDQNANSVGYVSKEFIDYEYLLPTATGTSPYGPDVSALRAQICDYGKQFIGTKYVWGGNDLYNGIDCSGFVKKVYKNVADIDTPRVSRDIAAYYHHVYSNNTDIKKVVASGELKPGDLIFYGDVSTNYINHVALYIGNEKILHSSTNYKGVAISSMYFYSIISYAKVLDDNDNEIK